MGRRTERAGATMGATSERGLNTSHGVLGQPEYLVNFYRKFASPIEAFLANESVHNPPRGSRG